MDPHSRAPKKNTSHGNEVPQDTTHLIQRPCYQGGSPCQDPAGNWTTRRPPADRKETQTAVVWSCLPFIRSGQNHLARHSERGKKTRQTEEGSGGKTTSGNGQAWSSASQWRTGKMEKPGCKIICGAPTTLVVQGLMMMMMMIYLQQFGLCSQEINLIFCFLTMKHTPILGLMDTTEFKIKYSCPSLSH